MRKIPTALAAHIEGGVTTLCRAWRVTRDDGAVLGFTEHDHPLDFAGTTFRAASGFTASEARETGGMAAPAAEVTGGFSSEAITEADLAAGRYDGARVEVFLVNWEEPEAQHLLVSVKEIGEVSRAGEAFTAELRSFAHRLSQENGRIYNRRCDASLGDSRCGIDMAVGERRLSGTVVAVESRDRIVVVLSASVGNGHFRLGRLAFNGGVNAGISVQVEDSEAATGGVRLRLWLPLEGLPEAGDAVTVSIGCDKAFSTCRGRFANAANFRGFPHMPGSDFAYSYVKGESLHDGSVLYE